MSETMTLPEITIEGDPGSLPQNAVDWWANGFAVGYNAPEQTPERPLLINDALAGSYFAGVASGQAAARDALTEFEDRYRDQPQIEVDLKGETLERAQERMEEAFRELFHQHMPHTENESETLDPLPLPNIVLVE